MLGILVWLGVITVAANALWLLIGRRHRLQTERKQHGERGEKHGDGCNNDGS